jgi:hypothetical protein
VRPLRDGILAGTIGAILSGAPSTAYALLTRADPLEAAAAAGTLLIPRETRRLPLLAAAVPAHAAISLGWGVVLAAVLPRGRTVAWGALAGLGIAALDLGLVARRYPRIRALPVLPQVADHVAYGITVAIVLRGRGMGSYR